MPQRDTLLPWRTVLENVILGVELAGGSRDAAREKARQLLSLFGLDGFETTGPARSPAACGSAPPCCAPSSPVTTSCSSMNPVGALDALTRRMLQQWLLGVRTRFSKTILFITHDIDEALLLGDRMLVFSPAPAESPPTTKSTCPIRRRNTILSRSFLT